MMTVLHVGPFYSTCKRIAPRFVDMGFVAGTRAGHGDP